ncbi:MAG TPA: NADPH:quinone reductase [Blastocatellia bacterium]|jgi:NADPH2:quinone reductase
MKAIRVHEPGGPEVMKLEEVPDPIPGPGQLLIEIKAVGVNPVDTYIRAGIHAQKPTYAYTPGSDAAGVVQAVGDGVAGFSTGQRVYTAGTITGAYAERALCDQSQAHPLPDRVSFAQGAAVNIPYATAYRALFHKAKAKPAERLLVHGATGGVGIASVQLARAAGLKVTGTGGTEDGRKLALSEGAHEVIDHHASDYLDQLMDATAGQGFDVILEMLANVNLANDLKLLAKNGRVVVIGSRGKIEITPRDAMTRDGTILGMTLFNVTPEERASIHAALVAGLENGSLRPVVGRELPLAEAARAHEIVLEPGAFGKIVLIP